MDAQLPAEDLTKHPAYQLALQHMAEGKIPTPAAATPVVAGGLPRPKPVGARELATPPSSIPRDAPPAPVTTYLDPRLAPAAAAPVRPPIPATAPVGATTAIPNATAPVAAPALGLPRVRNQTAERKRPNFFEQR